MRLSTPLIVVATLGAVSAHAQSPHYPKDSTRYRITLQDETLHLTHLDSGPDNLNLGGTNYRHLDAAAPLPHLPAAPLWATAAAPLVLRGVTVIDMHEGRHVSNQAVVIVGNRVAAIAPAPLLRLPAGARVVNARGKYLIPGLWDLHVHPQHYVDIAYPLFIANGVTGVRDAGSAVPLAQLGQWKREIAAGTRVGPRLIVSGPSLDGWEGDSLHVIQGTGYRIHHLHVPRADAQRVVDSLHAAGADMLKLYSLPLDERIAMAAEARRLGIPFGGHSEGMPGLAFSDSGATILDHETWIGVCGDHEPKPPDNPNDIPFDAAQCAAALQRLRRNHTWVTAPGMVGTRASLLALARRYVPASLPHHPRTWSMADTEAALREPASTAGWAALVPPGDTALLYGASFAALHRAGVPLVVGTDATMGGMPLMYLWLPGFMVPRTLVRFVLVGQLTPLEALQTATLNPALALGATDSLGTVDAGKVADLVLLDADPLADIWNTTKIRAVIANGRYYDRAALDRLLRQAEQAAARQ